MATISIIVPVYKVEPYLHRCVDSILAQSYRDFELILVDDGSPDSCGTICEEYAQRDSRVHVIHQENGGLSAARNAGIEWAFANSDSRWLAFIDSDDWVHRDYLKLLLDSAVTNGADIVACNILEIHEICRDKDISQPEEHCLAPEDAYCDFYRYAMAACGKLFSRELFQTLRFPVGKIHEDCYVTHILLFSSEKIVILPESLYYYFYNSASITRTKWSEKRLQEVEAHEVRMAWLRKKGYERAVKREMEVIIQVVYEQTEIVAALCRKERGYRHHLRFLRRKLRTGLENAKRAGIFPFDREDLWIYLMAYLPFPLWKLARFLQKKLHDIRGW